MRQLSILKAVVDFLIENKHFLIFILKKSTKFNHLKVPGCQLKEIFLTFKTFHHFYLNGIIIQMIKINYTNFTSRQQQK